VALRYDDADKRITLSVHDLVEAGPASGHLVLEVPQSRAARMAAGRAVHTREQERRADEDTTYQAEVSLTATFEVDGWTVVLQGRVDGLLEEGQRTVVEEVKSTAMEASRLLATTVDDWPLYLAQLQLYLWMLAFNGRDAPMGRLVLISLLDHSRHVLGVPLDRAEMDAFVRTRCEHLVTRRKARLAHYRRRRTWSVPKPFGTWRAGQASISRAATDALALGNRLLVQAPTGLGKTASVMHGVLSWALQHDRHLFWATSRNTQQQGVLRTLDRFREEGVPLTYVGLRSKEKSCLNDVLACRPDTCPYAERYYDKLQAADLLTQIADRGRLDPDEARELAEAHQVCPFQLTVDAAETADVVVGDVNYAASPSGRLARLFGDGRAGERVLVVDEAHQLVDRAREHLSPRLDASRAREALDHLAAIGLDATEPFEDLCDDIHQEILRVCDRSIGPETHGMAEAQLAIGPWRQLARRIDDLAFDYALLSAERGAAPGDADPWVDLTRAVLTFASVIEDAGEETVALVDLRTGREAVRLLCLDPSRWLGPKLAELAGVVGCSATLSPAEFHRDLLGLPPKTAFLAVPSPFPTENRRVVVAPRVSTAYRDRERDAPATAALLSKAVAETPGNVAMYFPSFAMLDDIVPRLDLGERTLLAQERGLSEDDRAAWLAHLGSSTDTVLAAVLGGVFAEGIDLPAGALAMVAVVGPALPPVGLERDLLRRHYDERFGQGFRYASLVPGMTRVVQAAGRLIRRPEDRGIILLVGKRYRWRDHVSLLPGDWDPMIPEDPVATVRTFWATSGHDPSRPEDHDAT
jgi:DNA excision repair protein ERCC-2